MRPSVDVVLEVAAEDFTIFCRHFSFRLEWLLGPDILSGRTRDTGRLNKKCYTSG